MSRGTVTSVSAVVFKIMTLSTYKQQCGRDQLQDGKQDNKGAIDQDVLLCLSKAILSVIILHKFLPKTQSSVTDGQVLRAGVSSDIKCTVMILKS